MFARISSSILLKRLLTVALLAGVFGLSSLAVLYFSFRGRTVEVPNVIGRTESDAEAELGDAGLGIKVISRVYSDKVPANAVSVQSPTPGTIVKTGQQVRVSLSLGAPTPTPQGN